MGALKRRKKKLGGNHCQQLLAKSSIFSALNATQTFRNDNFALNEYIAH